MCPFSWSLVGELLEAEGFPLSILGVVTLKKRLFEKGEFCRKRDSRNVNFVKNEALKM